MPSLNSRADASVLARGVGAEVDFGVTMSPHVAGFAIAMVVVDELNAVLCPGIGARIGQAFIDVAFASRANESWRAFTLEAADFVDACAVVMARVLLTIVDVNFADFSERSEGAGA